ncbi:MAG: hypothetical protein J6Y92_02995 [Lentisphaeria bacterium]|nr:hypothetical protein [Lentisphaeria bacterium]
MKTKPKNRKTALLIVVCVGLAWLGAFAYFTCKLGRGIQFDAASTGMRWQVLADITDPLESKYKIRECTVGFHPDDSVELRIELNPEDQAQAFDIAREVYELKQKSPILSQKPLELKMWVHDPAVDGRRIVYVDPDSRYGVNLHIYMPGAPDHKKKRDLEEYQELTRKWEEIHRQERMEELRRKAEEEDPDTP